MISNQLLQFCLWFIVVAAVLMYGYTAWKNSESVMVDFFGSRKKIGVRNLILLTFADGAIIGFLVGFLVWAK